MNTYKVIGEILDGQKPMPSVPVEINTLSIVKAAGVLLAAGVIFLVISKMIK